MIEWLGPLKRPDVFAVCGETGLIVSLFVARAQAYRAIQSRDRQGNAGLQPALWQISEG